MDANHSFEERVIQGIRGEGAVRFYGLPFLGDNNFLIDRLEPLEEACPAYWFERATTNHGEGMRKHATRMTIAIDRADMSQTQSALFAPTEEPCIEIPDNAWVEVGY